MTARTLLVVHRTGDQIIVMLPFENDTDARHYAMVSEDEAWAVSSAMRRMAATRDESAIEVGEPGDKLRVEHVNHERHPFEIVFDHEEATTVVDLRKDEAMTFADMLWGAHRAGTSFFMSFTLTSNPRRREPPSPAAAWGQTPRQQHTSRILGDVQRRVRGEDPKGKS